MKNLIVLLSFAILLLILAGCSSENKKSETETDDLVNQEQPTVNTEVMPKMIQEMVAAHNVQGFFQNDIIQFDIILTFNGKERLNGTIYSKTNSSKIKLKKNNGPIILFDGKDVYTSADSAAQKGARFDVMTWQYFALAPFKFADGGTQWESLGMMAYQKNDSMEVAKLTFGSGTGDAPDDWYIVYQEVDSKLLKAMAYIVTFGNTPQGKAEENPHAIVYSEYKKIGSSQIATKWTFHNWSKEDGLGEQLGEANLSNIRFSKNDDVLFNRADNYEVVPAG